MMTGPPSEQPPQSGDGAQRDLVQAVELLDQLIEEKQDALLADAALMPPDDSEVPLSPRSADEQQNFYDMWDTPDDELPPEEQLEDGLREDVDADALKQELLAELTALIDVGLRRVTETARLALAQELLRTQPDAVRNQPALTLGGEQITAETLPSLVETVRDTLSRYGLADRDSGEFYQDLTTELHSILGDGLEQIRRNLEQALQTRMSARAQSHFETLWAPRKQ